MGAAGGALTHVPDGTDFEIADRLLCMILRARYFGNPELGTISLLITAEPPDVCQPDRHRFRRKDGVRYYVASLARLRR
jgi:hypothetical protein